MGGPATSSRSGASQVKLRIPDPPPLTTNSRPAWRDGNAGRAVIYLLGQGHGDLRDATVTKPFVAPGTRLRLQAKFGADEPVAAAVLASLWLLCTYGGVGRPDPARVRRPTHRRRRRAPPGAVDARHRDLAFYHGIARLWPDGPIGQCVRPPSGSTSCTAQHPLRPWRTRPTHRLQRTYGQRPGGELRRASPLWLRLVGAGHDWRLLSFAFHGRFLPPEAHVELRQGRQRVKNPTVDHTDIVARTREWVDTLRADEDFADKPHP